MAGAFDRDIVVPKAPVTDAAYSGYVDPAQRKEQLKPVAEQMIKDQNQYTVDKASAVKLLDSSIKDAKTTLNLANKKGTPQEKADALDYYNTLVGLQPMVAKLGDEATNTYKGNQDILRGDVAFKATGATGISTTGKYYVDGVEVGQQEYVNKVSPDTNKGVGGSGGSTSSNTSGTGGGAVSNERRDAFAEIASTLKTYGFTDSEMIEIQQYLNNVLINPAIGPKQAVLDMRQLGAYKARFAGNETRVKAGLNALSESDYLTQEDSYGQYMKAYGVPDLGNRAQYASLIAGDVSATELSKRLDLAVTRVKNADPEIMKQLQGYYGINETDMVKYVLKPGEMLPELQRKVTTAEIGTAAKEQGLDYAVSRAEALAAYGIDRTQAIAGYGNIGEVLPTSEKLSDIYQESGIKYNQTSGEEEFFKANASAAEQRKRLKSMERAQFQGDSGINTQMNPLGKSIQGQF
jgi:hypothetical protein